MAGSADNGSEIEISQHPLGLRDPETRDRVRDAAAKLYGQGYQRKHIAKMLIDHLVPRKYFDDGIERPLEQRISQARKKLRDWERDPKFRDLIWELSVVKLDLQSPAILGGIAKKAKRGRIDAARLALEITGRHNPKGDQAPTQIALVVEGIPRPYRAKAVAAAGNETVELNGPDLEVEADEDV